jgi:hypothetical protein
MEFYSVDWRERAEEMRKLADRTQDRCAKGTMLAIAHDFELLAVQSEYFDRWRSGANGPWRLVK